MLRIILWSIFFSVPALSCWGKQDLEQASKKTGTTKNLTIDTSDERVTGTATFMCLSCRNQNTSPYDFPKAAFSNTKSKEALFKCTNCATQNQVKLEKPKSPKSSPKK